MRGLGLDVRSGLHTGEIEILPNDVGGIAVHVAAQDERLNALGARITRVPARAGQASERADPTDWSMLPGVDRTWRSKLSLPPIDHGRKFSNPAGRDGISKIAGTHKFRIS